MELIKNSSILRWRVIKKHKAIRHPELGAAAFAGDTALADLISSINSYEPFGKADGNSNAIASYFVNVAGREYLRGLFNDGWLKLQDQRLLFNGAYGSEQFMPSDEYWHNPK